VLSRYVVQQVRRGVTRAATLGVGILVAAVSFTLLTAAARTSEVRTRGAVAGSFRSAYDILVRPHGSQDPVEAGKGLVRPNFESGIFGGITDAQWRQVLKVPGVQVAAPVANLGYVMVPVDYSVAVDRYDNDSAEQLFRLHTTWLPNHGLSQIPGPSPYVMITSTRGGCRHAVVVGPAARTAPELSGPGATYVACYERAVVGATSAATTKVLVRVRAYFPVLVAAIDPVQENRLIGLDTTVVSGQPLTAATATGEIRRTSDWVTPVVPVIAASRTFQDEPLQVSVERVRQPTGTTFVRLLDEPIDHITMNPPEIPSPNRAYRRVQRLPATPVGEQTIRYQTIYHTLLKQMQLPASHSLGDVPQFTAYWAAHPTKYSTDRAGRLVPRPVRNDPTQIWVDPSSGTSSPDDSYSFAYVPPDVADVAYRQMSTPRTAELSRLVFARFLVQGTFDPSRLPGFSARSEVPLEVYRPPQVTAADAATRAVLGGRGLGPSANVAGYVSQPPALLTTLKAAEGMVSPRYFTGANSAAPISTVRVRVAGVTGPDDLSLERIRRVATLIAARTGLEVDITAGSSPQPQTVALPAGRFGQPALLLSEGWVKKGVAVTILAAVSVKSVLLFGLILVVTGVFLANAALATVRTRRRELGVLLAVGWSRRHLFQVVLAELALVGLAAGVVGAGVSAVLIRVLSLDLPLARVLLVPVVATVLTVAAGIVPAVAASRGRPLDVVLPARGAGRRGRPRLHRVHRTPVTVGRLAVRNVLRQRGRNATAAFTLALGVAALTAVVAVTAAFNSALVGSLLGSYVTTEVRAVDYLAVGLTLALAGLSVADVLYLNVTERAPELVTLQATGWSDRNLTRLTLLEALTVGAAGAAAGAAAGIGFGLAVNAPLPATIIGAGAAAATGILITVAAAALPARHATHGHIATTLADE
jgi:putative ABC transport system permease protein